jgi:hypothetical protein
MKYIMIYINSVSPTGDITILVMKCGGLTLLIVLLVISIQNFLALIPCFWNSTSEAIDAFTEDWSQENNWLVPPIYSVLGVFKHLIACKLEILNPFEKYKAKRQQKSTVGQLKYQLLYKLLNV